MSLITSVIAAFPLFERYDFRIVYVYVIKYEVYIPCLVCVDPLCVCLYLHSLNKYLLLIFNVTDGGRLYLGLSG